jgi:hypothetical protein
MRWTSSSQSAHRKARLSYPWSSGGAEAGNWGSFCRSEINRIECFRAIASGHPECAARILRATVTDTVIACGGEKSEIYPNQKFVYDVRARRLVSHFSYEPLKIYRARSAVDDAQSGR